MSCHIPRSMVVQKDKDLVSESTNLMEKMQQYMCVLVSCSISCLCFCICFVLSGHRTNLIKTKSDKTQNIDARIAVLSNQVVWTANSVWDNIHNSEALSDKNTLLSKISLRLTYEKQPQTKNTLNYVDRAYVTYVIYTIWSTLGRTGSGWIWSPQHSNSEFISTTLSAKMKISI